jgi:hypothetical protein
MVHTYKEGENVVFGEFCDQAKVTLIHWHILPNLAINEI